MKDALSTAKAYLAKLPPAISGASGHPATFRAACWCVRFGLSDVDAMDALRDYNLRCQPHWTEKELAHKLADARRTAGGQCHALRPMPKPVRVVWKIQRKTPPAEPKAAPVEPPASVEPYKFWSLRPGMPIPAQFVGTLGTWTALREDPAWKDHPQLS